MAFQPLEVMDNKIQFSNIYTTTNVNKMKWKKLHGSNEQAYHNQ